MAGGATAVLIAGGVAILEGDAALVSADPARVEPAALVARVAGEVGDFAALLVVFTTFDDASPGGPSFFLPIFNDTSGTGMDAIDRRAEFGARGFEGLVLMKRLDGHLPGAAARDVVHEIAHRHLAYMRAETGTRTFDLTGRQSAHWHAALHTGGSLMEGHSFRESGPGRFVVVERLVRFSPLDLYGLGLAELDEVPPFFFIEGARAESGAPIPRAAQLAPGTLVFGDRADLTAEDVAAAVGRRSPARAEELHAMFALVTRAGESSTSTVVGALAARIDALRGDVEEEWARLTENRGRLCTELDGCAPPPPPPPEEVSGCACGASAGGSDAPFPALAALLLRRRRRERSSGRSLARAGLRCPGSCTPPR